MVVLYCLLSMMVEMEDLVVDILVDLEWDIVEEMVVDKAVCLVTHFLSLCPV